MLRPLTDIKAIPMIGGAITAVEKALLPFGAYSDMKNLRNMHPSLVQRPGCRKLHTTADGTNQVYSMFMFSKSRVTDAHFFAQFSDGDILEATALPPTVTTGAFGSEVFSGSSGQIRASWAVLDDLLLMSNGADQHKIYAGKTQYIRGFHVVKDTGAHDFLPLLGEDYTIQVTDSDSTTVAVLDSLNDYEFGFHAVYLMTDTPIDKINVTVSAANGTSATLKIDYWTGSWTNVGITDGTSSGGATLAQSGTIELSTTAPNRTAEIPRYMFGKSGYWYKLYVSSGTFTEQDLSGYTESDSGGYLTVTESKCTFASVPVNAESRLLYDFGADYFGDLMVRFEFEITASAATSYCILCGFSNTVGDIADWNSASDGISVQFLNNSSAAKIQIYDHEGGGSAVDVYTGSGETLSLLYATLIRSGTTITLNLYSDSARTTLVDSLTGTFTNSQTYRYFYAFNGAGQSPNDVVSGYTQNFSINTSGVINLDSEVEVSAVTYDCEDFVSIQNVWNGAAQYAVEVQVEGTSQWEVYGAGAVSLDTLAASKKIMIASTDPLVGIYIDPGATPNATGTSLTSLKYWDGDSFESVGTVEDGTNGLSNAGWLIFPRQSDVHPLQWKTTQYYAYWYEVIFDSELSADMLVSVLVMPYFDIQDFGSIGRVNCVWKDRPIYTFNRYPQYLYVGSQHGLLILNGSDFGILKAGDGRANKVVCAKLFHNEMLVAQEEKGVNGGCLTLFEGYSPSTFGKLLLSSKIGSMNANSMDVVDGVITATRTEEVLKTLAFGLSRYGVWATDGLTVSIISDDIQNYFDPTKTECIRYGYESEMWLKHDPAYNVIRVGLVSGSSATKCNVFPVFDLITKTWSFDTPAQEISCMENVEAGSGNVPVLQVAGGIDDGQIYQLNYGTNDVSTAINATVTIELGLGGEVISLDELLIRLKAQAAGDLTVEIYENDISQATLTLSMLVEITNQTYRRHRLMINQQGQQISLKMYNSTASQEVEFMSAGYKTSIWENR